MREHACGRPTGRYESPASLGGVSSQLAGIAVLEVGANDWRVIADVPGPAGRLASTAVGVAGFFYLFGGYTVAEDDSEVSVASVHRLDPETGAYTELAPMPVPVDDAVSLVYSDCYIYLVSGWHDSGNVNLVQVYDTEHDVWAQATPFPDVPVFGHAGGIMGRELVICDGVAIAARAREKRNWWPRPSAISASSGPTNTVASTGTHCYRTRAWPVIA